MRWKWWAALAALYLLCLRAYWVGFFNDDAFYVMGARALLQGGYQELSSPLPRPLDTYPPGYPLLLAQVLWFFGGSLFAGQLLSVALSVAAVWLVWRLSEDRLAALAFAVSPLQASLSGTLLAEPLFAALSLLILLAAQQRWRSEEPRVWLVLGALSGYLVLVRLTGLAMPAALVGCLLLERRFRQAALAGAASAAVAVPYYLRNLLLTGRTESRIGEMADAALRAPWGNALYYAQELFGRALLRAGPLTPVLAAVGLAAAVYGLRRWKHKLLPAYLGLYLLVHLAWPYQSGRYVYPVLGLAALLMARAWAPLAVLSAALSLVPTARVVHASLLGRTPMNTPPAALYAWLRERTDGAEVLAADLDARLWLWTDRKAAHLPRRADAAGLKAFVDQWGVDYVVLENTPALMRRGDAFDHATLGERVAALADERLYELVFLDDATGARIYRVR